MSVILNKLTIGERLSRIKQLEFVSVADLALLLGVSERTVWRRLPKLPNVVRDGRITRIHRRSAMHHFLDRSSQ